ALDRRVELRARPVGQSHTGGGRRRGGGGGRRLGRGDGRRRGVRGVPSGGAAASQGEGTGREQGAEASWRAHGAPSLGPARWCREYRRVVPESARTEVQCSAVSGSVTS